jgi:alpha-beta hydrolase superfamily lysophospholipase
MPDDDGLRQISRGRARRRRWWLAGAVVLLLAAGAAAVVALGRGGGARSPDAFYTPPAAVPATPGALVRSEPFTRAVPKGARAWRILYTTTRDDTTRAVASALVVAPTAPATRPRPVIAWAHGTTGFATRCAPSLLDQPFAAGGLPALDQVVARGFVVVATDYVGLGTAGPEPYLVGRPAARSVLDAVRAAHRMHELRLAGQTVVWGYSQGGAAALWTGILAPTYAPDAHVVGVAAIAPASELTAIAGALRATPAGDVVAGDLASAYAAIYPDVRFDDVVAPAARDAVRAAAGRCVERAETLEQAGGGSAGPALAAGATAGSFGARLQANIPNGRIDAPLLIAQGTADTLVPPSAQLAYVRRRCGQGQQLDYRTYGGYDHVSIVRASASPLVPDLLGWTRDRIAAKPVAAGCATLGR